MSVLNDILNKNWPTTEEIESFQAQNPINRMWSLFDYTNCQHDVYSINYAGDYEITTCIDCGFSTSKCLHTHNLWSPDEKLLRCKTCGMDVT